MPILLVKDIVSIKEGVIVYCRIMHHNKENYDLHIIESLNEIQEDYENRSND